MSRPLYIISACSISAQQTYDDERFLNPIISSDTNRLAVIDPDYAKYISPVAIRRMSRLLKRGITAGMRCLEDAGVTTPDAIIIGTARGSVTDMENFLHDMIDMNEEALNPTAFIQSTYNSVNGWLAMLCKSTCYNQTYVHRGFSFELSLFDAQLLAADSHGKKHYLVGGIEEMTAEYFDIRHKIAYYKNEVINSLNLFDNNETPGTIGGEGAHFFTLGIEPAGAACALHAVVMLQKPTTAEVQGAIVKVLSEHGIKNEEIDVLISGMNGDSRNNFLVDPMLANTSENTTVATFKHLVGDYDTASGFGLWLGSYIFKHRRIPQATIYRQGKSTEIKNILICNTTISHNVSLMLLKGR